MSETSEGQTRLSLDELRTMFATVPYTKFLGVQIELKGDELTLVLPFKDSLIGNPMLPALHGGVVGALMEFAALAQLTFSQGKGLIPKVIDVSIDYLRSGRPIDTYARAHIRKMGRRVANVQVEAWQLDSANPIAALHGHFLLQQPETIKNP